MRTYYLFQAVNSPDLRGFAEEPAGARLPSDLGPWTLARQIEPNEDWTLAVSRAVVAAGLIENGFISGGLPSNERSLIRSSEATASKEPPSSTARTIRSAPSSGC